MNTTEISNLLLTVSGGLLTILASILWWVIKKFTDSVKDLKSTTIELKTLVSVIEERLLGVRRDVERSSTDVLKRIEDVENDLSRIDGEIVCMKQSLSILKTLEEEHHGRNIK